MGIGTGRGEADLPPGKQTSEMGEAQRQRDLEYHKTGRLPYAPEENWNLGTAITGGVRYEASALPLHEREALARQQQAQLTGQIEQWGLTGQGPSAAQGLLERQRGANIAQAQSAGKSMAGVNPFLAQRMAQGQAARASMGATEQAAIMRAQEQQAMLGMAAQGRAGIREGDIAAYQAEADAYARAQTENAAIARQEAEAEREFWGNIGGGVAGMLAMSDRRFKRDIRPMEFEDLEALLKVVGGKQ